jgi:hypothetical protein
MALVGGAVGYKIQATRWWGGQSPNLFGVMLLAMPAIMGLEQVGSLAPAVAGLAALPSIHGVYT